LTELKRARLAHQGSEAHQSTRGRTRSIVHTKLKALRELASLDLDEDDACEVLAKLTAEDSTGRLKSVATGEWMYIFKPRFSGATLYLKLILRSNCIVISFHEDVGDEYEEDA